MKHQDLAVVHSRSDIIYRMGKGRAQLVTLCICRGSRRGSSASLLRIAEEAPGPGPDSLTVLDASPSPSPTRRKKSLSWKGDDDLCEAVRLVYNAMAFAP